MIILSTTNGTVAIKNSLQASRIYAASLLNGRSVAKHLLEDSSNQTILLVCSGSQGRLAMEDFIGSGQFIDNLIKVSNNNFNLSDSAKLAYDFYRQCSTTQFENYIRTSITGKLVKTLGYEHAIDHSVQRDIYDVVPIVRVDESENPYLESIQSTVKNKQAY